MSTRLIEVAFPLKQASLDSVHEKNVRHGHISTLHIWPARRPLAACRAALIATLLPDPGNKEERDALLERLAGRVKKVVKTKKLANGKTEDRVVEETEGGILHWGRESGPDLEYFRQKIREAYGGRAPRVLDPFAGGGAIPLEAMRLGCEVTAVDINPVAWFILKCTLEYPQKLVGKTLPLPKFAVESAEFMEGYFKNSSPKKPTKQQLQSKLQAIQQSLFPPPEADLAWHVRAWGFWVLQQARRELARFYPVYADFEPLDKTLGKFDPRPPQLVPLDEDGLPDEAALNAEFDAAYLRNDQNPRWVAKPTVAYLWARTVKCKNCRATIPLLKTRWLCKKDNKRVVLTMRPNADRTGVVFGVEKNVSIVGGNAAQRRGHDNRIGGGTMSRSGAQCPCCPVIMTMEDIRFEGKAGRLGAALTAVVVDGLNGKEYRVPMAEEIKIAAEAEQCLEHVFADVPFGLPQEPTPKGGNGASRAFSVDGYGFDQWQKLFTPRQLLAIGTFIRHTRDAHDAIRQSRYGNEWAAAISAYLTLGFDRFLAFNCANVRWKIDAEAVIDAFARFALPILWDFGESVPINRFAGSYLLCYERISLALDVALAAELSRVPDIKSESAKSFNSEQKYDAIVTDPPYYDAIPYSDLMDFFYVWMRRMLNGLSTDTDSAFSHSLGPKWNHDDKDGELIDDSSRHGGDKIRSKTAYEDGMFNAFQTAYQSLNPDGRFVIVFAHKQPDAWETLASAIIRAGFVVDGSWPIQTEMGNRTRALSSAALSSSVWLVCKKRPEPARPGWDNRVLEEMRVNIGQRLREFWDAGIRGPDFVWAATGPALEAYSKHPVVKKANEPGQVMTVSEFLKHVRRMVVDFVVGRVLAESGVEQAATGLDDVTTYYLLHRHDFGMAEAPVGPCILYAISCNLSDAALAQQHDVLIRTGGLNNTEDEPDEADEPSEDEGGEEAGDEPEEGSGSKVKLKPWNQRKGKQLGYESPGGQLPPLIDQVHRLMHLWKAADVVKVNEYLDAQGLRRNALFHQLLQALIELAPAGSEERSLLESISNHLAALGVKAPSLGDMLFEK